MKTIELFSGTGSFSKVAEEKGMEIFRIEKDPYFESELCEDILNIKCMRNVDIIWASPPCTTFSVASIGKHWTGGLRSYIPKSKEAEIGIKIVDKTIKLIKESNPTYWFIENPRGVLRKIINKLFIDNGVTDYERKTITYCQYGDTRMKPTDIWTNCRSWIPKPMCKNGDSCHISAPRGSKTGTQGLKNAKDRSVIPPLLFKEIFEQMEINND